MLHSPHLLLHQVNGDAYAVWGQQRPACPGCFTYQTTPALCPTCCTPALAVVLVVGLVCPRGHVVCVPELLDLIAEARN